MTATRRATRKPDTRLNAALRIVQTRISCDCWDANSMEMAPTGTCARCQLESLLTGLGAS